MGNVPTKPLHQSRIQLLQGQKQHASSSSSSSSSRGVPTLMMPPPVDPTMTFDGGYLAPHGVYPGPISYDFARILHLIQTRRLAPFFQGLSDWAPGAPLSEIREAYSETSNLPCPPDSLLSALYESSTSQCPICFLHYPPALNRSSCCDQPICTECFVQIQRHEPHDCEEDPAKGLVSEPASCPFCLAGSFAVGYQPMTLSSDSIAVASNAEIRVRAKGANGKQMVKVMEKQLEMDGGVVTTDLIRPGWSLALASARAKRARKAALATSLHKSAFGEIESDSASTKTMEKRSKNRPKRRIIAGLSRV